MIYSLILTSRRLETDVIFDIGTGTAVGRLNRKDLKTGAVVNQGREKIRQALGATLRRRNGQRLLRKLGGHLD